MMPSRVLARSRSGITPSLTLMEEAAFLLKDFKDGKIQNKNFQNFSNTQ